MLRTELPTELLLKFGGFCVCTLQLMDLEEAVPLDCCRLVKYDEFHDYLERSYEGEEETPMGLLLGGVKSTYMFDLLLETRRPDQVFQCYKPGGKTCSYIYAFSSSPSVLCDDTSTELMKQPQYEVLKEENLNFTVNIQNYIMCCAADLLLVEAGQWYTKICQTGRCFLLWH